MTLTIAASLLTLTGCQTGTGVIMPLKPSSAQSFGIATTQKAVGHRRPPSPVMALANQVRGNLRTIASEDRKTEGAIRQTPHLLASSRRNRDSTGNTRGSSNANLKSFTAKRDSLYQLTAFEEGESGLLEAQPIEENLDIARPPLDAPDDLNDSNDQKASPPGDTASAASAPQRDSATADQESEIADGIFPPDLDDSDASSDSVGSGDGLSLTSVLQSVADCYPVIEIAIGELQSAAGKRLAASGEFDDVFRAHSISQPLGFYQTYRNGAGVLRPLFSGGEVYGDYRIGDGNFEPWYGERETNEGGELKAGFSIPFLKDSAIDKRRAGLMKTAAQQNQTQSNIDARLLMIERAATQAYWDWVATGRAVRIQQQILKLAQIRQRQINLRVEAGDLAEITRIDNRKFIAKRTNDLIKANRSLEKAAIKLSLFHRGDDCQPVIPTIGDVPGEFPDSLPIEASQRDSDLATAITARPELKELAAARREACVDLQYARNLLLPKLDMKGFAGQDLGGETSSKGDKTPFELQIGLHAEVPIQRRLGQGKIQVAEGKIAQIDGKTRMVTDKIRSEIQDAASAVNAAYDQIEQSQETVLLNRQSLRLGRIAFEQGDIDLISLNLYENSVAEAELQLLDAQYKYFLSLAAYYTAIGQGAF